jgi:Xaa-Pro dipeptidase
MNSARIEALACFSPPDVLLVSGYWPVMGKSVALLTRENALAVVLPEDEVELAEATSAAHLIPYKGGTLTELRPLSRALAGPARSLASCLQINSGEIGVRVGDSEQATSYQSANHFRSSATSFLQRTYPHATLVAADKILDRLKTVRTSIELEQLRCASRLAAAGFHAAEQFIEVGRTEIEIAAESEAAFNRVASNGFERGRGYFFCMSGPNSAKAAGAYARTRNRRIEKGDFVMIHANTVGDGTWTDITRTYIAGEPSPRQRHMQDAVMAARDAALNAVAPGVSASTVDAAARDVLTQHGFGAQFVHAVGHGVGFAAADANAMPRLHPRSPDVLEAGMTFNIEPALYFKGEGGLRHCDVVACTQSGAEVLTSF